MNYDISYNNFYDILLNLREAFHRSGRFDDSNAKLDEIVKILLISYYEALHGTSLDLTYVQNYAKDNYGNSVQTAKAIREMFLEVIKDKMFYNEDGTNIFGANAYLNIQPSENDFANELINQISKISFISLIGENSYYDFDIVNECFGHFVRENFRNNKEDAQYMTPAEIAQPILEIIFADFLKNENLEYTLKSNDHFYIMDPTCGVGTLLIDSIKSITKIVNCMQITDQDKKRIIERIKNEDIIGQDKVDRMVRLSKINMMLIGANVSNIHIGNSICGKSSLDKYMGKVDFIFTNPPFGAEYSFSELNDNSFPILNKIRSNYLTVNSELLLLDKCISLLKPNGCLAIVLPDSVVSAKGIYEEFRKEMLKFCNIKAIIELPAVTFAQAGTRTKTVVLYLQKSEKNATPIVMGVCDDVGYIVKEKVGVPVKINSGTNQLIPIKDAYLNFKAKNISINKCAILSTNPSVTVINQNIIINDIYNPSFYNANRLLSISELETLKSNEIQLVKLSDLVEFVTASRKSLHTTENINHISVLYVNPDGTIDFEKVKSFNPICKGRQCFDGDLIFSKINPRIPRIAVIPHVEFNLVCSNEFEIMCSRDWVSPYLIMCLLKLPQVSSQIENLTSGTSSSHCRIKTQQLKNILIPFPISNSRLSEQYTQYGREVQKSIEMKYNAEKIINQQTLLIEQSLI